jgi:Putative addiction module component
MNMPMTKEQIILEAKKLSWRERGAIVEELMLSQSPEERAAIDAAWCAEAKRREEAVKRGELETIDGEEAMRLAYEAIRQKRTA